MIHSVLKVKTISMELFRTSLCYLEHHYMLEEATVPQFSGVGGRLVGLEFQMAGLGWVLGNRIERVVDYECIPG